MKVVKILVCIFILLVTPARGAITLVDTIADLGICHATDEFKHKVIYDE